MGVNGINAVITCDEPFISAPRVGTGMIFVFSGTGNSYHVARRIADALGVGMVDVAAAVRYKRFGYDAAGEPIGFVFPTYYYGLPSMVRTLVKSSWTELSLRNVQNSALMRSG